MRDLEGISGLDYSTQRDMLDSMYMNPNGVNFSRINLVDFQTDGDIDYHDVIPVRRVNGTGRKIDIMALQIEEARRNKQRADESANLNVLKTIKKQHAAYMKRGYIQTMVYNTIRWMEGKNIPGNLDSLNSHGEPNAMIAYALFAKKLVPSALDEARLSEAINWFVKTSYCRKYYELKQLGINEENRKRLVEGRFIIGGKLCDDNPLLVISAKTGEPILKYASRDLIDCCEYTDKYTDIIMRLNAILNSFWSYNKPAQVRDILNDPDSPMFDAFRYLIEAMYVVSKTMLTKFPQYITDGYTQVDQVMINFGLVYEYDVLSYDKTKEKKIITPFYKMVDKSGVNVLGNFDD